MHPTFADPKTDFVFKRVFGAESRKHLLAALLNHLLELDGDRSIVELQHLTPEQRVDLAELKLSIVDVKCTDASGRRFVVEIQVLNVEGFEKRVVYNASKAYVSQLRSGEQYPALCDVFGVTICDFNLWDDKDPSGAFKVPMLSRWRMQEQHSGERGLAQIQFAFLELPKYAAGSEPITLVDKWAYFFREARNLEVIPAPLSEGPFRDAMEVTRTTGFSERDWDAYERAKIAEQDARGALALERREGRAEGVAIGQAQGIVMGRVEGVRQEKRAAIVRVLVRRGLALSDAARARIDACVDVDTLDRWFDAALVAPDADDALR
jgi:predicted transposase/invertase (TIGR01784 family)